MASFRAPFGLGCSNPGCVAFKPKDPPLIVDCLRRPLAPGRREAQVHVVDAESRELAQAMLVTADARLPSISRTLEVGGQAHHLNVGWPQG